MRADRWTFRTLNLIIAGTISGTLWYFFHNDISDVVFIILFGWIVHVRGVRSRLIELNDRLKLNNDLIGTMVDEDADIISDYEVLLDKHGFHEEADEWDEKWF